MGFQPHRLKIKSCFPYSSLRDLQSLIGSLEFDVIGKACISAEKVKSLWLCSSAPLVAFILVENQALFIPLVPFPRPLKHTQAHTHGELSDRAHADPRTACCA
jgi:hypothetical protein